MAFRYSPKLPTNGLCFAWDGINHKCWDGSSVYHTELIGKSQGEKQGSNTLHKGYEPGTQTHIYFAGGGINQSCYIEFQPGDITVPTGNEGTWMWAQKFVDSGNIDHPNFGKETTGTWSGTDGFVFGTGWGTDGPRWGIGGTAYTVYANETISNADYRTNVWQIYVVTYQSNSATGLQTYLCDSNGTRLCDQRSTPASQIGTNGDPLRIGCTNQRSGNWNGYMDFVYMWDRALTSKEVFDTFEVVRSKFGL